MAKKNKKRDFGGFVYSTDPNFSFDSGDDAEESLDPSNQELRLHRETKGRGGKAVVIIKGFTGPDDELKELEKALKAHCGTGGSSKDGEIIIQGDQREKVLSFLQKKGFKTKKVGG